MKEIKALSVEEHRRLMGILQSRFEKNMNRHPELDWALVLARLEAQPGKAWSLNRMEESGGEPDVAGQVPHTGEYLFYDCSPESPAGRRSLCYDREALESRKDHPPSGNVLDLAASMDIELLSEEEYRSLQKLGPFDTKTSSWLKTPPEIRKAGGALFAEFRYGAVFVFHNSAPSYYGVRGFRGLLRV